MKVHAVRTCDPVIPGVERSSEQLDRLGRGRGHQMPVHAGVAARVARLLARLVAPEATVQRGEGEDAEPPGWHQARLLLLVQNRFGAHYHHFHGTLRNVATSHVFLIII